MAVKELTITPSKIKQAEAEAIRLCNAAFAPSPVLQPDGSTIDLCWSGRIARAYERLAAERIARNTPAVKAIEAKVKEFEREYNAAHNAAQTAASHWASLCTAAGMTFDAMSVYPTECTCAGCTAQRLLVDRRSAEAKLSIAIYALMAPNDADVPPIITLLRKANEAPARDELWSYWKRILDAGEEYIAACKQDSVSPNWRLVLAVE